MRWEKETKGEKRNNEPLVFICCSTEDVENEEEEEDESLAMNFFLLRRRIHTDAHFFSHTFHPIQIKMIQTTSWEAKNDREERGAWEMKI